MLKLKLILISSFIALFAFAAIAPSSALAQKSEFQQGVNSAADNTGGGSEKKINDTISSVLNILTSVVGIIAVIMIIVGGFRYITSGGSSEKVSGAKNTILYAIIGLIIVAIARIIVEFVLNQVT